MPDDINVGKANTEQEWINVMIWVRLPREIKEVWVSVRVCVDKSFSSAHLCMTKCAFQTTAEGITLRQVDAE